MSGKGAGPGAKGLTKSLLKNEGEFFLIQGASLFFTLVAGFILIRNLGMVGYGQYVLMVAMGQMLNALGNSGLFIGASELLSKSDKTDKTVLKLFSAMAHLRLRFSLIAGFGVMLVAAFLLYRLGLTSSSLVWAVIAALGYGGALVFCSLFSEGFMLLGEGKLVSRYDAGFGVISAISSVITSSILKDGVIVLFFLAMIEIARALVTKSRLYSRIGKPPKPAAEEIRFLKRSFWSLLPNVTFSTIRTEFVKFVLSIQGQAAILGAFVGMRRFGRAMAPLYKYLSIAVVPKLTRAGDKQGYLKICIRSICFLLPPVLILLGFCYLFPGFLLGLLGTEFADYQAELRLIGWLILADLTLRFLFDASRSRGWLYYHKRYEIAGFMAVFFACLFFLNMAELSGVIYMNLFVLMMSMILALLDLGRGLKEFGVDPTRSLQVDSP